MNLFDILPERYFSIFASKNRKVYADGLLTLFEMLESDESVINKDDYIRNLKDKGKKDLEGLDITLEDDYEADENVITDNLATKANYVFHKLEQSGWIDVVMEPQTQDEVIVLPAYTIFILRAFKDIISDEESPYLSLVHSTYSELRLEDDEPDDMMYLTLNRCYENTKKLKVELVTLTHSIRIYKAKLKRIFSTNDVLHDFLDVYKNKILDRYYHPLKTFDNVAKFKRPIINILEKWLSNEEIRNKLVLLGCATNSSLPRENVEQDIIMKCNYIIDTYLSINNQISNIDKENSEYTKASTNKILFLNNTDRTTKGHLENILKHYARNTHEMRKLGQILSKMQDAVSIVEQGYINSDSVTLPIIRKGREEGNPLQIFDFDVASNVILNRFLESTKNIYSKEKIYAFMRRCFGNETVLKVENMPLDSFDAFISLIFASIKVHEDDCFYTMEIVDDMRILNNCYLVPHFEFKIKENENV